MGIVEFEKSMWDIKPVESLTQKLYNKQVKDITNIAHTEWYKEIKRYWKRVQEWAEIELKSVSADNLKAIQLKCNIAEWFVTFLENLENTRKISEQVKKAP